MPAIPPDVVAQLMSERDNAKADDDGRQEDARAAADELIHALHAGDADGVLDSLRALISMLSAEPDGDE